MERNATLTFKSRYIHDMRITRGVNWCIVLSLDSGPIGPIHVVNISAFKSKSGII
jgi:hypothetical protein